MSSSRDNRAAGTPALHLWRYRSHWWLLVPAGAIVVIGLGAFATAVADDQGTEGWGTALAGLGALAVVPLAVWIVAVVVSRRSERRRATEVLANPVARWPQYATAAQWDEVVEEDHEARAFHRIEVIAPLTIVTALLAGLGAWAAVSGVPEAAFPLGGFWLLFAALVVGRQWNIQRERHADLRRRRALPRGPDCWIARTGLYHEDHGLVTFDDLVAVEVIESDRVSGRRAEVRDDVLGPQPVAAALDPLDGRLARSGWSLLELTFDPARDRSLATAVLSLVRRLLGGATGRVAHHVEIVHVRVPPPAADEAGVVAALLAREHGLTG